MSRLKTMIRGLLTLALLWPATILHGQTPSPDITPDPASLTGQLLVASPDIGDPRFDRAVILMVHHDKDGAFGIVINQPAAERSVAELLDAIGEPFAGMDGMVHVVAGGPVQRGVGFVIHSTEYHRPETIDLGRNVAVTSSAAILRDIGHHKGPIKVLVAFGYAGWGPGQLEHELADRAWAAASLDPTLVFDADRDQIWDRAWAHRTINL
jgi:putative transcriptional regulator